MLTSLRVRNLALVDRVDMEFGPGLNVVTGETGAGKSVLMGALNLLVGGRADKSLIRTGSESCTAEAVFDLGGLAKSVDALLEEAGLDACEEGRLILRRVIKPSGGQNLVNDAPVTLQLMKKLGELLVDMHGPHDHQSLFSSSSQRDVLDAFGGHGKELEAYRAAYAELRVLEERRAELEGGGEGVEQQVDFLSFRVREIKEAGLSEEEETAVRREHEVVGNVQEIASLGGTALDALSEGDGSALDQLGRALSALDKLGHLVSAAQPLAEEVGQLARQARETATALAGLVADVESDPARLDWLDERMALYARLKKKYGPATSDVLRVLEESEARLADLLGRDEKLKAMDAELRAAAECVRKTGQALTAKRKKAAELLAKTVASELGELGFRQGKFDVEFTDKDPGRSGLDQVEFMFAPNPGEPARPLRQIASSGEMSRLMLALKAVLARHDRVPLLVFDEIDANLGGEAGNVVGGKLAQVAGHHQVLCITHLPQVAVFGTLHFEVSKQVEQGRTETRVRQLRDGDERVDEIARMLGGVTHTRVTRDHARALLEAGTGGRSPASRSRRR